MAYSTKAPSNELVTYKKLHIMTEFILSNNQEDNFVLFLKELQFHPDFISMGEEIRQLIGQYDLPDEEVYAEIKKYFIN
ncbi:hypothetical protein ACQCT3_18135 [Sutcliffiella horikoshii]|uniref:hypothetical protein n=1 Tax=Sutcliffiella horikoshii TaxID=79883 RepID=UPI003CF7D6D5